MYFSRSSAIQSQRNSVISNGRTFHAAASAAAAAAVAATQHNDIKLQLPTVNGDINGVNGHYKTVISGGNSVVKQSPNYSLLNGMHSLHNGGGGLSTTPNGVIHSSLKIKVSQYL